MATQEKILPTDALSNRRALFTTEDQVHLAQQLAARLSIPPSPPSVDALLAAIASNYAATVPK